MMYLTVKFQKHQAPNYTVNVGITTNQVLDVNVVSEIPIDIPPVIGITSNDILDVYVSNQVELPTLGGWFTHRLAEKCSNV